MPRGIVAKKGTTELRGIGDQGQPRKRLRTRRSQEEAIPLNTQCKEGDWHHQDMDSLESAAFNGAVCHSLGDRNNKACVEMAFDFSKYFNRLFYNALAARPVRKAPLLSQSIQTRRDWRSERAPHPFWQSCPGLGAR